jgi:hypothetical protein
MDDCTPPDTNVVLLRRKGDPCEAERERVASTIFAEPDDVATFSRGNLVPPRPDARDTAEEPAPSPDPFFDRLQAGSKADESQRIDLADDAESTDAYFNRLAVVRPWCPSSWRIRPSAAVITAATADPDVAQLHELPRKQGA